MGDDNHQSSAKARLHAALQAAVQGLQWTYALFWKICPNEGILVWSDGYYNGEIKTKKTVQPIELTTQEATLHRSQHLQELYQFLSAGEAAARRPSMALSPEDLTESEWFYLLCISFSFPPGLGLPGKAYANGHHIWLSGANEVDSQVFCRAILAKSAGIQTVVCIPLLDGVVELGTTALMIEEDEVGVVERVKTLFNEASAGPPRSVPSEQSTSTPFIPIHTHNSNIHLPSDHGIHDDAHYCRTVLAVLDKGFHRWCTSFSAVPSAYSAFNKWPPFDSDTDSSRPRRASQFALKYVLFNAPHLAHKLDERRRREKLNRNFAALRSLVPFVTKFDKASILGDAIVYVKQLQRKILELEAEQDGGGEKAAQVEVSIIERDALVEVECKERAGLLLDVMQVLGTEFGMDITTVQSSISRGILTAEIRAKVKANGRRGKAGTMEVKKWINQVIQNI